MNKNAIKKFAIDARNKLIASVTDKAGMLGITANGISDAITKGRDFEVYKTSAGTEVTLNRTQSEQRRRLVAQIEARGFEAVIEEVAYTWFNRICAIRFMEVNDYLSVRVLSSIKDGKTEPDIVTNAPDADIEFTDAEKSFILEAKVGNKLDELFRMLFIKQCHELNDILPELFEKTEDYTEMLLNISYTNEDDVIRMLVDTVDEKDFNVTTLGEDGKPTGQVEIIGWLYQYYNTELKDDTFAKLKKNVKITKERIPAATQLFTPDWIVRYMVENSVGRIWIEHLRAIDSSVDEKATAESFGWKYYLPEAEQEESVNVKLAEIRTSYAELKPEDITCIDPCMGSGHILIAMFDVLMDIYKSTGYSEKEAAFSIVENNIHGLDIDKRAYQLAYFAVMMKGRGYNRRFFRGHDDKKPQPKVYAIQESNGINRAHIKYFGAGLSAIEKNDALNQIDGLLQVMTDAREYGSILNVDNYDWDLLRRFAAESGEENQLTLETIGIDNTKSEILKLIDISEILARKYKAVITNPPYMNSSGMNSKLLDFIKKEYPDSKADISFCFMERCNYFTFKDGIYALINIPVWMNLSSCEELRIKTVNDNTLYSLLNFGRGIFGSDFGSCAFVFRNGKTEKYKSRLYKLFEKQGSVENKEIKEINFEKRRGERIFDLEDFLSMPGHIISCSITRNGYAHFVNDEKIGKYGTARQGLITGKNDVFLRLWFEVDYTRFSTTCCSEEETERDDVRWYPYDKGGEYKRWYGNNLYVVNWQNRGFEIRNCYNDKGKLKSRPQNIDYYFKSGLTWTALTAGRFSMRYSPNGHIFDAMGPKCFVNDASMELYILGLLNSCVGNMFLEVLCPNFKFDQKPLENVPIVVDCKEKITDLVQQCIRLTKDDYDSFETSCDFKGSPIIRFFEKEMPLKERVERLICQCEERKDEIIKKEESMNEAFISMYGLENELTPYVDPNDVTLSEVNAELIVKNLISYAVGCMLGRYSLDKEGISYAGGIWNEEDYISFKPDEDGIIPITDEEYFSDDIVGKFVAWMIVAFGKNNLENNLDYIAKILNNNGKTARDSLRKYFMNSFFEDHCTMYSISGSGKRPIYWLFDSGKQNGFKCLIYVHRYNANTVGNIRIEYLHKTQAAIEQALQTAERIKENGRNASEKSLSTKNISKYTKQLGELAQYDEAIAYIANRHMSINLDDGIKDNYSLFQGVEVAHEGKKVQRVNLLAPIK